MAIRVAWHDLPAGLRGRIEAEAGAFLSAEDVGTGHNCLLGAVLQTERGRFFLKGITTDNARAVWTQANEAAVNVHVGQVTAPLAFHVTGDGWDVLGFQHLDRHRHADLTPGSPDLPLIAAALKELADRPGPPDSVQLRTMPDRWRAYAGDDSHLLAGTTLAHTDLHRHNILIGGHARFVDWAWPTLAAPWVDTACVGLQLIHGGHHPKDAELWCQQIESFATADESAVSAFVNAARKLWHEISTTDPQPWKREVADAAARWAHHRGL